MARKKRMRFKTVDLAETRYAALSSIDPKLDLGNGLTIKLYLEVISAFKELLKAYNAGLSHTDELHNQCNAALDAVEDMNGRMLAGVASKFGRNSNEYEMAGGTRKSERRKPSVSKKKKV